MSKSSKNTYFVVRIVKTRKEFRKEKKMFCTIISMSYTIKEHKDTSNSLRKPLMLKGKREERRDGMRI